MHPGKVSITSTDSFLSRAQRSEAKRVLLWITVLAAMLALTIARRLSGGVVMSTDDVFYPTVGVLFIAINVQILLLSGLRRANRESWLLPQTIVILSAIFDLFIPAALLGIAAFRSPRGAVPALSSPTLLLMPLLILTSVLRLRPRFTLCLGLACALIHWILAIRAVVVTNALPEAYPVYFAYGFILALTAIAGMLVAREVKAHVREAADEAAAHEQSEREMSLVQRDLSVARDIQTGLLPAKPPKFPGFDIAGMNRPADKTGGDYYDWQELPDGRLVSVLADVSGHGIGPALVMAVCRAYARSTAPLIPEPAALLGRLNVLLHGDLPGDRFITFVIAILNKNGTIQLLSAGHGPTLLYRAATKTVQEFHGDGMPLGISPLEEFGPTSALDMNAGDVLVMLTDGFFEWSRPEDGEQFGIPRLHAALAECANEDAETILKSLDDAVRVFTAGGAQPDDMTAIVIRRTAPSGTQL